jgi:UDP-N-acetyl-D-glucosamine dehydrogenase
VNPRQHSFEILGENMQLFEEAREKFKTRCAKVGVLGLGYAGLPLACSFAEAGFQVTGFDVDDSKVQELRHGRSYIAHIDPARIERLANSGSFRASSDFSLLRECNAAIICVPTPLGEGRVPDLQYVESTALVVQSHLHRGMLVVLESTTYPGTTEEVLLPMFMQTGMSPGEDFFLAFSPEREDPANKDFNTRTIPKIVGGVTPHCLEVAAAAYGEVVEHVVRVSSARVAESSKLLENIYRCVNIAMINELKLLFERMDIDVWEVVKAASTKPFGFTPFYPGPGMGGHCIPIDPFYLTWKARQYDFQTRFIELAGEINSSLPVHVVNRLTDGLNLRGKPLKGASILLVGVAYKPNVDDVRESPAIPIIRQLHARLARVAYHDPMVPHLRSRHLQSDMFTSDLTPELVRSVDAVVIVTNHHEVDYEMIVRNASLVVDTRNATAPYRSLSGNVMLA